MKTGIPALASIVVARGFQEELHVIGLGRDDGLRYLIWQDIRTGEWHGNYGRLPNDLNVPWSTLAVAQRNAGNLQVVGLGRDDGLPYLIWQDNRNGEWHGDYGRLPNDLNVPWSTLATGRGNANNLQVIGLGRDDGLPYLIWQDHNTGEWHGDYGRLPNSLNMPWSTLATGRGNSDNLQVVGLGHDDGLPHLIWQDSRNGEWHGDYGRLPISLNMPWSTLATGRGNANNLQVVGLGRDGFLYPIWQDYNTGEWHGDYGRLPNNGNVPWSMLAAAHGKGDCLHVVGLGCDDGLPHLIWQDPSGQWYENYGRLQNNVPWATLAMERSYSNDLQIIGLGRDDGLPYLVRQDAAGNWNGNYGILPLGVPETPSLLEPGEIIVFSEEKHMGRRCVLVGDTPDLNRYFPAVNSLQIGPNTSTTIYSEKNYRGLSQELSTHLASFSQSALQGAPPKSLKLHSGSRPFTGYWVIEVTPGRYLSVCPGEKGSGILATADHVLEREAFRIIDRGEDGRGRRAITLQVRGTPFARTATSELTGPLTIDRLENATLVDEQEARGFRKFSLKVQDEWVCYKPDTGMFVTTDKEGERTIFLRAVKIADDETQVGELLRGEVALFEKPSYWGKSWVFHADYPDFCRIAGLNDEASSVQLGPLTGATLYPNMNYDAGGQPVAELETIENIPSLAETKIGDNRLSSLDIWHVMPPGVAGISVKVSLSQDYRRTEGGKFEEFSAYRSTIQLPPDVETVEVWATRPTKIEVENVVYEVDEVHSATLKPNLFKCLIITTDAIQSENGEAPKGSLSAPGLKIRTNTMHESDRMVIYPDQEVHRRLTHLEDGELYGATFKDKDHNIHYVVDRTKSPEVVAGVQEMIKTTLSTVKYDQDGAWERTLSPEALHGKAWALDFFVGKGGGGPAPDSDPESPLPAPAPSGSTFREINQDELQALLDAAESRSGFAAQSVWDDIGKLVQNAVSVAVVAVKQTVTFFVTLAGEMADKVRTWVAKTTEDVINFVEEAFKKVGVAATNVVEWLQFVFDWDDILETKKFLVESFKKSLDQMVVMAEQAKEPVRNFFQTGKERVTDALDDAIKNLGGTPGKVDSSPQEMPDAFEWILSKIMGSPIESPSLGTATQPDSNDSVVEFWEDAFIGTLGTIMNVPDDLGDVITMLVRKPDEPQLALAELLEACRNLIVGLLDVGENIALGLLDLVAELVGRFREMITAEIQIPFLKWLGMDGELGFSILDVVSLIVAVPVTVMYKAIYGEAPVKKTTSFVAQDVVEDVAKKFAIVMGGICDWAGAWMSIGLDIKPETDKGTAADSLVDPLAIIWETECLFCSSLSWLSSLSDKPDGWPGEYLRLYETGLLLGDILSYVASFVIRKKPERLKRSVEPFIYISSGLGVVHLWGKFAVNVLEHESIWVVLADHVGLSPEAFPFLRLPAFAAPAGIPILIGLDFLAGCAALAKMHLDLQELDQVSVSTVG